MFMKNFLPIVVSSTMLWSVISTATTADRRQLVSRKYERQRFFKFDPKLNTAVIFNLR